MHCTHGRARRPPSSSGLLHRRTTWRQAFSYRSFFSPRTPSSSVASSDIEHPYQGYHDHTKDQPRMHVSLRDAYTGGRQMSNSSRFVSTLTSLMSAGLARRTKTMTRLATDHVKTYLLDNCDGWFDEAT